MSLVTIILTTLDSERYVARSIASCLSQSHHEIELLVVDGGSKDATLDIVARFADQRIRVISQADNAGHLPGAINLGMAEARGEYLTWMQDDSTYESIAIAEMLAELKREPLVGMVYADYWDVDSQGRLTRYQRVNDPEHILNDDVVRQCFLFRRQVYEAIGPMATDYFPVHEVPWRIKIAQRFILKPLHMPLMHYMVHSGSLTGRIGAWNLQRMIVPVLLAEGHITHTESRRRLARVDVEEAYDRLVRHTDFSRFQRRALAGILRDPTHLTNRGLVKLLIISFMPFRHSVQRSLQMEWERNDSAQQDRLKDRHANPSTPLGHVADV